MVMRPGVQVTRWHLHGIETILDGLEQILHVMLPQHSLIGPVWLVLSTHTQDASALTVGWGPTISRPTY